MIQYRRVKVRSLARRFAGGRGLSAMRETLALNEMEDRKLKRRERYRSAFAGAQP